MGQWGGQVSEISKIGKGRAWCIMTTERMLQWSRFFVDFLLLRQTNQFSKCGSCFYVPPFQSDTNKFLAVFTHSYKRTKASTKVIETQCLIKKKKQMKKFCAEPIVFPFSNIRIMTVCINRAEFKYPPRIFSDEMLILINTCWLCALSLFNVFLRLEIDFGNEKNKIKYWKRRSEAEWPPCEI